MANHIKLHMFQSGTQRCKLHNIKMNQGDGAEYEIPIPWFLLTHPKGNVLLDGGLAAEGLTDPRGYWGTAIDSYQPHMTQAEGCVTQLQKLGIMPEEIKFIVQSHLHSDHTGAIGRFPNAIHIVQRKEYEYAFAPDWFAAGAYIRKDFDQPGLKWQFIEDSDIDLFGDGVLQIIFTPGHSAGHQSFLVTLPETGSVLLAVDAVYTEDHWNERALPGFMVSATDAVRSVQKLHAVARRTGSIVVPGHDPKAWLRFRLTPHYYG